MGESCVWWKEFPFEKERDMRMGLFKNRYMAFDFVTGYRTGPGEDWPAVARERPSCDEQDKDALWGLLRKIGQHVGEPEYVESEIFEIGERSHEESEDDDDDDDDDNDGVYC